MSSNSQSRDPAQDRRLRHLLALVLATSVAACGSVGDNLPVPFGLPSHLPQAPAEPPDFVPIPSSTPVRDSKPLTEEERKKLEAELVELRDRQEHHDKKPSDPSVQKPLPEAKSSPRPAD